MIIGLSYNTIVDTNTALIYYLSPLSYRSVPKEIRTGHIAHQATQGLLVIRHHGEKEC